jgi:ubiquinone/menaquinone biosynthesis C-methylase UbiE
VVSRGDELPFANDEYDFVISSHVIEHFFDPIKAICEWVRVAKHYVFVICPHPDALESDRNKPITTLQELIERNRDMTEPEVDTHEHYTRWTMDTFLEMCEYLGLVVCDALDPDDKAGNGFAVVIDCQKSKQA